MASSKKINCHRKTNHKSFTKTLFKHSEYISEKQKQTCLGESHKTLETAKESHTNQYSPSTFLSKVHRNENQK